MSELRPGYQLTEYGTFPDDWQSVTVAATASRAPNAIAGGPFGSDLVSSDYTEAGVPVIRGQNMGRKFVSGGFAFVSPAKAKNLSTNCAGGNDLVFTQRGTLGQVSIVPNDVFDRYVVSQSQMKLSVDRTRFSPEYLYYYFTSQVGQRQITDSAIQTGVPHTNLGILRRYRLPVPKTLVEQQAIAEALGDADALIEGLEALIAKKRDIKQGAMQELLTGRCRLPGFLGEWRREALGTMADISRGASPRPIENPVWFDDHSNIGWVRISDVSRSGMTLIGTEQRLSRLGIERSRFVPAGSLIMSIAATVGRPIITGIDVCIHDGFVVFSNLRYDLNYLYYKLRFIEKDWGSEGQTGSQMNLNTQIISKRMVAVAPTLNEQRAIAAVLSNMDAEIAALREKLTKARAVKQGMMQVLLTGEIRLI